MTGTDAIVERIVTRYDTITVVGASRAPAKAAHSVPAHMQRHGWRIIPVNPYASELLAEPAYRTLAGIPEPVGLVDVFRPSGQTPDIARQAATALWLQPGIASAEARAIAEEAGLLYVEDRCLVIEQRRLGLRCIRLHRTMPGSLPVRLTAMADHYRAPGWFTRNVFNRLVAFLTRRGISVMGSRVLAVKGRTSGEWRTTPVNLLTHEGHRYLVAPRGATQWVRNLRVVGTGELRLGRGAEGFRGRELTDEEKVPILRAYLRRWKAEVGIFFEGTGPDSSDEQLRAIAPKHPAFEVLPPG